VQFGLLHSSPDKSYLEQTFLKHSCWFLNVRPCLLQFSSLTRHRLTAWYIVGISALPLAHAKLLHFHSQGASAFHRCLDHSDIDSQVSFVCIVVSSGQRCLVSLRQSTSDQLFALQEYGLTYLSLGFSSGRLFRSSLKHRWATYRPILARNLGI
jgi:hypothetical protein